MQSLDLGRFYTTGDARLLELSRKAAALAMDKLATLNKPEDLAALTNLALFDTVVYCGIVARYLAFHSPLTRDR